MHQRNCSTSLANLTKTLPPAFLRLSLDSSSSSFSLFFFPSFIFTRLFLQLASPLVFYPSLSWFLRQLSGSCAFFYLLSLFFRLIYGGLLPDFPEIPLLPLLFLEIGSHLVASYFRIFVSFLLGKWAFFEFPQTNVFVTAKLELNRSSTIIKNSLKRMIYSSL